MKIDILKMVGLKKNPPPKQNSPLKNYSLPELLHQELQGYIRKEDLQKYLEAINRNKEKKAIWDSLSTRQKLMVLRRVAEKRGMKI